MFDHDPLSPIVGISWARERRWPHLILFNEPLNKPIWYIRHGRKLVSTAHPFEQRQEAVSALVDYSKTVKSLPADWVPKVLVPGEIGNVWIYFISTDQVADYPIKIGKADDPLKRLAGLQTSSPYRLQIIGAYPADADHERNLHIGFAEWRLEGEWFSRNPLLMKMIDERSTWTPPHHRRRG